MKKIINKILRKFGIELHGLGYLRKLAKSEFLNNAFEVQKKIVGADTKIIFDVGANTGGITSTYLSFFPEANIYAFEPLPELAEMFMNNHSSNMRVKLYIKALSNEKGSAIFNINKSADTSSLLKSTLIGANSDAQCKTIASIKVETDTIDNFCSTEKITYIDILKLDVQGSEYNILKGASKMLSEKKIGLIYSEVYFKRQYENQPLFYDISNLLLSYGYALKDLYNPYYNQDLLLWGDAIYIPVNFKS